MEIMCVFYFKKAQCALVERKGQQVASRYHGYIILSHLQLFTAVDLSSPSHSVLLFTPRVRAPILNISMRKCLDGEIFSYS